MSLSEKQLAANRANAARSTGPRTPEGKARSAANATRHGFTAANFAVVFGENAEELEALKDDAVAFYNPANAQEMLAVERIALAQFGMMRLARMEVGLLTDAYNRTAHMDRAAYPDLFGASSGTTAGQRHNYTMAIGFNEMVRRGDGFRLFLRYQAQTERLYRRAIEDLERLRAVEQTIDSSDSLPTDSPNEPIPDLPNEPVSPVGQPVDSIDLSTSEPPTGDLPIAPNEPISKEQSPAAQYPESGASTPSATSLEILAPSPGATPETASPGPRELVA